MADVKIGLIGLGRWGELELSAFSTFPYVDVVAVCSRSEKRCREICKRYRIKKFYLEFNEIVKDPEIQAIVVSTEPERHIEPTLAALEAGKNVLTEKPLALNLKDIDRIIQKVKERKDTIFMVGHTLHFDLRYEMLKERIKKKELGKVVSIYSRRNVAKDTFERHARYNPMLETGVHEIDLARWYMEDEVKKVYAKKINVLNPKIPDTYWVVLTFSGGKIAVIETSWLIPRGSPLWISSTVEVIGTKGIAYIDSPGDSISIWDEQKTEYPDVFLWPTVDEHTLGALRRMLEYFSLCVLKKEPQTKISPNDARESIRIALAAIESAQKEKEISLQD
ncbi:Gfo/Idh/MocA family oxidoreductase [Candidatus Aerophobetes bacterium]|nr:Gfo/Idh/MocA family oxidoreductase [Candidatus Aerophobetes bacterium]